MIETIKDMKPAAARLLLVYLLAGRVVDEMPKKRVMELCGIENQNHYYVARRELVAAGFLVRAQEEYILSSAVVGASDSLRSPLSISSSISSAIVDDSLRSPSPVGIDRYINNIYIGPSEDQPVEPVAAEGSTQQVLEAGTQQVPLVPDRYQQYPTGTIPDVDRYPTGTSSTPQGPIHDGYSPPQVLPLLDRCMDADAMDASGDRMQRTSPFQARRRAQIPLIQEAWNLYFPKAGKLAESNARSFLSWAGDSTVFVHDQLARIAERKPDLKYPLSYVAKVLPNEYQKSLSSAKAPAPNTPAEDEELYKPSDEELQKMKEQSKKYASLFPNEDE